MKKTIIIIAMLLMRVCANAQYTGGIGDGFSGGGDIQFIPTLLEPNNNSLNNSISTTLIWNTVIAATEYEIQVSVSDSTFSTILFNTIVVATNQSLTNLDYGTQYFWRLRAMNATDTSAWSSVWNFTTRPVFYSMVLVSPNNNSTNLTVSPTLLWKSQEFATQYQFQLATDNQFANITNSAIVSDTSTVISNLAFNTPHFWRVRAMNATDTSAWSSVWNFTTRPAFYSMVQLSPNNNSTNLTVSPTFLWKSQEFATQYQLQLATDNQFANITNTSIVSDTSAVVSNLDFNTQHFWRVQAMNATDTSAWSSVWNFTTEALVPPTLLLPTNNSQQVSLNPTLSWASAQNPDSYRIHVYTSDTTNVQQAVQTLPNSPSMYSWGSNTLTGNAWTTFTRTETVQATISSVVVSMTWDVDIASDMRVKIKHPDNTEFIIINGTQRADGISIANGSITTFSIPINDFNGKQVNGSWTIWIEDIFSGGGAEIRNASITINHHIITQNNINNSIETSNSKILSGLTPNKTHFWRVRAIDGSQLSDWSSVWSFTTEIPTSITQNIPLALGLNMISANVTPTSTVMSGILAPLAGKYSNIKNMYGQTYAPPFQTSLSSWNIYQAYQIRMNQAATMSLTGTQIVPEATPIVLNQTGLYWLPYFRTSSMAPGTALASISGKYLQVKNIQGQVYQPPFSLSLTQMLPNNGYIIRMSNATGTLTYPANTVIKSSSSENVKIVDPSILVRPAHITGKTAFIALDLNNVEDGDEIGVFTRDGMLVGSSVWQYGMHGVVVWGDDESTNVKDGASEGEALTVKIWSKATKNIGAINQIALNDMTNNDESFELTYETDAVHLLKATAELSSNETRLLVSPQPASTEVMVKLNVSTENEIDVKIYSQEGKLSLETSTNANGNVLKVNTSNLSSGIYQMILTIDGKTYSEKVVVVR